MATTETVTVQTSKRKREMEEMAKLFQVMSELERAKVFGYMQGIESTTEKMPERQAV